MLVFLWLKINVTAKYKSVVTFDGMVTTSSFMKICQAVRKLLGSRTHARTHAH